MRFYTREAVVRFRRLSVEVSTLLEILQVSRREAEAALRELKFQPFLRFYRGWRRL